jgi:hypothetical protein
MIVLELNIPHSNVFEDKDLETSLVDNEPKD